MINYLKNKYTAYKNRGFTLIELIVVMAIIAVLVLLAAPKFIGQTNTAQDRNIQNDVKVAEMKVSEALIDGMDVWDSWTEVPSGTLEDFIDEDGTTLYGRGGPIYDEDDIEGGDYRVLPGTFIEQEIRSRLEGTFYANKNGTVYYESGVVRQSEADKKEPSEPEKPVNPENPSEPEEPVNPENPTEPEEPEYPDEETRLIKEEGYTPIATAEELNDVRDGLGKKYIQVADIDLSGYSVEGWNPIGNNSVRFTGIYNGGNYVITGLKVKGGGKNNQGLFGYTEGATIRNVGLIDNIVTGKNYVGGLVGKASDSTIENSYATGSVKGEWDVGGLVGGLDGFVANRSNMINNSYATGSVEGTGWGVGGLVGSANNSATISNSYATGPVEGSSSSVGGLVGLAGSNPKISNSYWDTETTGRTSSAEGGTGKSTDEMKLKATYSGWDFVNVWKIDEGNDYPKLR